ncbi:MAG: HAD family hydrolase [Spirochaetota bacterium]
MSCIDCIYFDLGNVLYNLDYQAVWDGFTKCCRNSIEEIQKAVYSEYIFTGYETGSISSYQYYTAVTARLNTTMKFQEFKNIWNSLLIKRRDMFDLAEEVKKRAAVGVLSNTNEMNAMKMQKDISRLTDRVVYSFQEGCRKPHRRIYEIALQKAGARPGRTMFIDDRAENVKSAEQLGIRPVLFTGRKALVRVLTKYGIFSEESILK